MSALPTFRQLVKGSLAGEEVAPLIRTALYDPDFPSFNIKVRGFEHRKPDGWFHPSTHPLWPERMLYYYLAQPEQQQEEIFDPTSTIAVTAGSFFHDFTQIALLHIGALERFPNCPCKPKPEHNEAEVYLVDESHLSRGHSDGVLKTGKGFEYKTMAPQKARRIPKLEPSHPEKLEWLKDRNPDYFAQCQEYLRISKREQMRLVAMVMTYPFEIHEFAIDYDPWFAGRVRDKYARVVQAVADCQLPDPCCKPRSAQARECSGRTVCPIGRM